MLLALTKIRAYGSKALRDNINKLQYVASVGSADNIDKEQKFYSLPKRCSKALSSGITLLLFVSSLETSNFMVSSR